MPKKRILFEGYVTVEGLHVILKDINMETKEAKGRVELSIPPQFMDEFVKRWQDFKNGTSKEHCILYRNYFDDHPDMDYMKYLSMEWKRSEDEKSKQ